MASNQPSFDEPGPPDAGASSEGEKSDGDRAFLRRWSGGREPGHDSLARRRADAALCEYFRQQKYRGPDWDYFVHELLSYGLFKVRALVASQGVFRKMRIPPMASELPAGTVGDVDALISDVTLAGFKLFLTKGLLERYWTPSGGASLATYFTNACRMAFREKYRDWRNQHGRLREVPFQDIDQFVPEHLNAEDGSSELLDDLMELLGESDIELFVSISEGYTYAEIGERLGISTKAVEGRVKRGRLKASVLRPRGWRGES